MKLRTGFLMPGLGLLAVAAIACGSEPTTAGIVPSSAVAAAVEVDGNPPAGAPAGASPSGSDGVVATVAVEGDVAGIQTMATRTMELELPASQETPVPAPDAAGAYQRGVSGQAPAGLDGAALPPREIIVPICDRDGDQAARREAAARLLRERDDAVASDDARDNVQTNIVYVEDCPEPGGGPLSEPGSPPSTPPSIRSLPDRPPAPTATAARPAPAAAGGTPVPADVLSVDMQVMESFPLQYGVMVRTILADSCTVPGGYEVEQDGNAFDVTVLNLVRGDKSGCARYSPPVELETLVMLDSEFAPGQEYAVRVNGIETTFVAR